MNLYKKLFNIVRNNPNTWEENKIELLWNILLSSDKRSFTEYFKEEHNIDLSDTITFKELLILCKQYKLI
jgi:hypothetical protein|tara:strand:+ start:1056 stop:1265 length:210 start_codon:yes stop_codon:yes gene_type:complete